jgi:uncharacterized Zn-binding protein involved in type VI secretion
MIAGEDAMPEVSTRVDVCQGHDACAPRSFATHSPNVLAESFEVTRQGDELAPHGCPEHPPHGAVVAQACPTVLVNGRPIAVIGSTVTCPSGIVATGRPTVLVNEGKRLR